MSTGKTLAPEGKNTSKMDAIKWAINLLIPLAIALIPTSADGFTEAIKWFLVITSFFIILMATGTVPMFAVAIALPAAYIVFLADYEITSAIVMGSWKEPSAWTIIGGTILSMALQKTGLMNRIANTCILVCGGTLRGVLYGLMLLGILLSLVMPDVVAKAVLLGALGLGICSALDFEKESKPAAAIGMACLAATVGPSALFPLTNGVITVLTIGSSMGLDYPSFTTYLGHVFLPQLVYCFLTVFVIARFFVPKDVQITTSNGKSAKEYFRAELDACGVLSTDEKKVAGLTVLLLVGLFTTSYHGVDIQWLFVFASAIFMCPGMAIIDMEDVKKINFAMLCLVTACLSIGLVSTSVGFGTFISNTLTPYLSGSPVEFMGIVWLVAFIINFALTPGAATAALAEPVAAMATAIGISHLPAVYALVQGLDQVVLPYEYPVVLVLFGYGMCSFNDLMKYNVVRAILSFACLLCISVPYWSLIGLL